MPGASDSCQALGGVETSVVMHVAPCLSQGVAGRSLGRFLILPAAFTAPDFHSEMTDPTERPYRGVVTSENRRLVTVRYQDTDVAEAYDRQRFHSPRGRYNNWRLRRLLNKVLEGLSPGSVVLDIPCGTGRIDNWLLNASLRVIAADISMEMLAVARQKVRPMPSWLGFLSSPW